MNGLKTVIEFVMEILETIVFIGSLFIVIYLYIVQPNQVKGMSMDNTFRNGDYIFTSKISYKFRQPQRGDVVVFYSPKNPEIEYIKRIIGLPGDKILIKENKVYLNDRVIEETYILQPTHLTAGGSVQEGVPVVVPAEHLFVMGDNRPRSADSREFGSIPFDSVIGLVFYRYYPTDKMGFIENPFPEFLQSTVPAASFARL